MFRLSLLSVSLLLLVRGSLASKLEYDLKFVPSFSSPECEGSLGKCNLESQMITDSEMIRRILAGTNNYISYSALSKNNVPCSKSGASYYNCGQSSSANVYTRACTKITQCQRDTG
ncbi:hypothetical protein KP509_1Z087700 [Ceratopteris richardii]|nr:hypothetical protein KP509_1Z087700 [Ceratopteris richardii]